MSYKGKIPVIIPAYEPDDRLVKLIKSLRDDDFGPIVVINDGSGEKYDSIFQKVSSYDDVTVLNHENNQGKGAAIKMGLSYVKTHVTDCVGAVTADSDGQHSSKDIQRVAQALWDHPESLILGERDFHRSGIPLKSYLGNVLTAKLFHLVTGHLVADTQTGLRGIPLSFFDSCLRIQENRFDYEMKMLMREDCPPIVGVPIHTIYDSASDHQTHFDPIKDSIRIYVILLGQFLRYTLSSLSSSVIDLVLFTCFCHVFHSVTLKVALATVLARICSASYNYLINKNVVYKSDRSYRATSVKYLILAVLQMAASALLTSVGAQLLSMVPVTIVKIIVDSCLFVLSYYIQKKFVFS